MKNKPKSIIITIILVSGIFLFTEGEVIQAAENQNKDSMSRIESLYNLALIESFIESAEENSLNVLDSNATKVEGEITEEILRLVQNKNLDKAVSILREYDYRLHYATEERSVTSFSDEADFSPLSVSNQVTRTEYQSHFPRDRSDRINGSWLSQLTMTYTENFDGTFTALGSPTIRVETSFGAAFNPTVSNYSTGFSYAAGNRGINYYGSYDVSATLEGPITIGGLEIPLGTYHWGRTTDTFNLR